MKIPLVGGDYSLRSLAAAAQTCRNLIPQKVEDESEPKNRGMLILAPGRHLFKAMAGIRGQWSGGGRLFVAQGNDIVEIDELGAEVSRNTLPGSPTNDGTPVFLHGNGNQLLIVASGLVYCDNGAGPVACTFDTSAGTVDTATTLVTWKSGDKFVTDGSWVGKSITINAVVYTIASVTDDTHLVLTGSAGTQSGVAYSATGDPVTGVWGAFLDSTFYVQRPAGGTPDLGRQVNFSAVNNGLVWDPLDFFSKDGYPDYLQSIQSEGEQLYLQGTESIEVWQNDSSTGEPVRIPGASSRYGAVSRWAQVILDGDVYFLGGSSKGQISAYVMEGFKPKRISTRAEEAAWMALGTVFGPSASAYAYQEEGGSYWVITNGEQCWVYDATTGIWHTRATWNSTLGEWAGYPVISHSFIPEWGTTSGWQLTGLHIVATADGLYVQSLSFYDEDGANIKWERALPYQYADRKRMFFGRMELEMETGTVALGTAAPVVTLDYSDNRGQSFRGARTASQGEHDDFSKRVFWNRNGSSFGRVWRLSGVGKNKVALIDLQADVRVGK